MNINIPLYVVTDADYAEDFDMNDWSSIRFFIPTDFEDSEDFYIFTYDDGTFEFQKGSEMMGIVLNNYSPKLPVEFWREFLKNILSELEIVRSTKL